MTWTCDACTFVHAGAESEFLTCAICSTQRASAAPVASPAPASAAPAAPPPAAPPAAPAAAPPPPPPPAPAAAPPRRPRSTTPWESLPSGNRDRPGCAALPRFHDLLFVGNEVAASHARAAGRPFDFVLSTVEPVDVDTFDPTNLSNAKFLFPDKVGAEKDGDVVVARRNIVEGARALDAALRDGARSLVHCAFGQNRSAAICVAYAVLYRSWDAKDAGAYARSAIADARDYRHQRPFHNARFQEIVAGFVPNGEGRVERKATGLTAWLQHPPKRPRHT